MSSPAESRLVLDFTRPETAARFRAIDDVVMGGRSGSGFSHVDGAGRFSGRVSLENNGGFASVRSGVADFGMTGTAGLELEVRGDGSLYRVTLKTDDAWDGVFYHGEFRPDAGTRLTVWIPYEEFVPRYRGRVVRDAPPLDPSRVRQVGFMISDKQAGEFSLELRAMRAWTAGSREGMQ